MEIEIHEKFHFEKYMIAIQNIAFVRVIERFVEICLIRDYQLLIW